MLKSQMKKLPRQGAVTRFEDGREVCSSTAAGRREYKRRTLEMWKRQNYLCSLCGFWICFAELSFEHSEGRGMNGSHRDDRTEIAGAWHNSAAHLLCNAKKASVRLKAYKSAAVTEANKELTPIRWKDFFKGVA